MQEKQEPKILIHHNLISLKALSNYSGCGIIAEISCELKQARQSHASIVSFNYTYSSCSPYVGSECR
jgi:hypothetical protein